MFLSKIFTQISNDLALVRIRQDEKLDARLKAALKQMGWQEFPAHKCIDLPTASSTVISYEGTEFRKGNFFEGSVEWYRDLAEVYRPEHQPGLLTRLLG